MGAESSNYQDRYGISALPPIAVLPRNITTTRFACSECMLRYNLRPINVYGILIASPDFNDKVLVTRDAQSQEKRATFEQLV